MGVWARIIVVLRLYDEFFFFHVKCSQTAVITSHRIDLVSSSPHLTCITPHPEKAKRVNPRNRIRSPCLQPSISPTPLISPKNAKSPPPHHHHASSSPWPHTSSPHSEEEASPPLKARTKCKVAPPSSLKSSAVFSSALQTQTSH